MNEKSRERVPKPEREKIPEKITKSKQVAIAKVYDQRFQKGERSEDILADLSSKYDRDVRTVQRYVSKGREIIASNKQSHPSTKQSAMVTQANPLIVEAKRKHFERLSKLIMTWQSQLGFKPKPSERYSVSIFPVKFKAQDAVAGSHEEKYFPYLRWQVAEDGAVDVWFLVEEDVLFQYLRLHIQSQRLWQNFEDLKNYLARGIREVAPLEEGRFIHVEEADALAADIFNELEIALAREGVFSGKCPACPGY